MQDYSWALIPLFIISESDIIFGCAMNLVVSMLTSQWVKDLLILQEGFFLILLYTREEVTV